MKRRKFIHIVSLSTIAFLLPLKTKAEIFTTTVRIKTSEYVKKIIEIIHVLKTKGTNLVLKIMNGKEYKFDPTVHYPYDGGIYDEQTKCRVFFHAHRKNEYGHFHTFTEDNKGNLIHLVLISMNKEGIPIGLSTVNRWVTGDKYVKANELKQYLERFSINKNLFKEEKVLEFIQYIFKAYKSEIFDLFDKRDAWIEQYVNTNYNEPFEDRNYEVLSSVKINVFNN